MAYSFGVAFFLFVLLLCDEASLYESVSVRPSVRRMVGWSDGRSVTSYFSGLLGATIAVYTALFFGHPLSVYIFLFASIVFVFVPLKTVMLITKELVVQFEQQDQLDIARFQAFLQNKAISANSAFFQQWLAARNLKIH